MKQSMIAYDWKKIPFDVAMFKEMQKLNNNIEQLTMAVIRIRGV